MFKKSVIVRALAYAVGTTALSVAVAPVALAQTSATGNVAGQVDSVAGTTVVVENTATGQRRTVTPSADGKFAATSLSVGSYRVSLMRNGAVVSTREDVIVTIGATSEVSFAGGTALQAVEVVGRKQAIDVTNTGSTTTFTAAELSRIPVQTNVGAVIQLAPQTTRGDSRYGGAGAPSFGGAGSSENAYYINGFPVTTLLTQVGFSQLPFNSIAQAQLLTGGYGAEFGRSTGGVVNIVTKSGGNDLTFGTYFSLEPSGLRARQKDLRYENVGRPATDGKLQFYLHDNKQETIDSAFYVGGPIVKDKLFFFFAGQFINVTREGNRGPDFATGSPGINNGTTTYTAGSAPLNCNSGGAGTFANSASCSGWQTQDIEKTRGLLKLDWNITDAHHLEYTKIYDNIDDRRSYYSFDYNTLQHGNTVNGGNFYQNWGPTPVAAEQGAQADILKYTGYLTDKLTFTAVLGETRSPHRSIPADYNPALPVILATNQAPGVSYPVPQTTTAPQLVPGAFDQNRGARVDLEWRATSAHTLRGGIDYNKIKSKAGTFSAGGGTFQYLQTPTPGTPLAPARFNPVLLSSQPGPLAQQGYYVQQTITATSTTPTVIQAAEYIEDRYQVTDRILLSLGLRNESFDNRNGDGESYIKISKQLAPRLGAAWDVRGDASLKVFANAGRYHVPIPTNVAIRGAGASLNTTQNFAYTGVDQTTGAPTGTTSLSVGPNGTTGPYSPNNEFGQSKDPRTVADQDIKGMYQDELSFGIEQAVSRRLTLGAKFTYRKLRTVIDDFCDDRPFLAYAARNGIDTTNFPGFNCALFNPGRAGKFMIDLNGDGTLETVNLSAAELGYPKVDRKYMALDLTAEYPYDGKLYGKVIYTLSRNKGNTEGQLLSDIGQADVATTQAFDFPEFSINSNGLLPNDRKHQFKAYGYLQAFPEWGVGLNALAASGRPKNCIGNPEPVIANYAGYTSAYFFCNGVATPRGSQGRLPWDFRLDANVTYRPSVAPGFALKVDVFNLFNRQVAEVITERYNQNATSATVRTTYSSVQSYTAPRYVKLSASYDYKF